MIKTKKITATALTRNDIKPLNNNINTYSIIVKLLVNDFAVFGAKKLNNVFRLILRSKTVRI